MDIKKSSSGPYLRAETTYFLGLAHMKLKHIMLYMTQHIQVDPSKKLLFSITGERNHVIYVCVQHFDMSWEGSNSATTVR